MSKQEALLKRRGQTDSKQLMLFFVVGFCMESPRNAHEPVLQNYEGFACRSEYNEFMQLQNCGSSKHCKSLVFSCLDKIEIQEQKLLYF